MADYSIPGEVNREEARRKEYDTMNRFVLTTGQTVFGHNIHRYLGIVSESVVIGQGLKGGFSVAFNNLTGSNSVALEQKICEAKNEVLNRMRRTLYAARGNAIIGLSLDVEILGGDMVAAISVTGTGTMVLVQPHQAQ